MAKLLSIIIPTYNMEEYLPRCLDSLIETNFINDIEIIVVNDGSKDRSSEIAHSYKSRFPQSVVVIDKENGNYGSTINAALPIATGKYVKVLDSDDWFNPKAFDEYLGKLQNIDADLILTSCATCSILGKYKNSYFPLVEDLDYSFSDISSIFMHYNFKMHSITYRLELLLNNNYRQTEGISYTDNEWAFYPMQFISNIRYINCVLYQYFIGREGQTVSPAMLKNDIGHQQIVTRRMLSEYPKYSTQNHNLEYMTRVLINRLEKYYFRNSLIFSITQAYTALYDMEKELSKDVYMDVYQRINDVSIGYFPKFRYIKFWRKSNRRYSYFVLSIIRLQLWLNDNIGASIKMAVKSILYK